MTMSAANLTNDQLQSLTRLKSDTGEVVAALAAEILRMRAESQALGKELSIALDDHVAEVTTRESWLHLDNLCSRIRRIGQID